MGPKEPMTQKLSFFKLIVKQKKAHTMCGMF